MIYMKFPACQNNTYKHIPPLFHALHMAVGTGLNPEDEALHLRHLLLYDWINVISWPAICYLYCSVRFCGGFQLRRPRSRRNKRNNGNKWRYCVWTRSAPGATMSKPEDSMDTGDTGENSVRFVPFFSINVAGLQTICRSACSCELLRVTI
jgi:hypothetical protein